MPSQNLCKAFHIGKRAKNDQQNRRCTFPISNLTTEGQTKTVKLNWYMLRKISAMSQDLPVKTGHKKG